jgi:hypothetical protein
MYAFTLKFPFRNIKSSSIGARPRVARLKVVDEVPYRLKSSEPFVLARSFCVFSARQPDILSSHMACWVVPSLAN